MSGRKNKKRAAEGISTGAKENARDAIEQILLTTNAQGSFYSQGQGPKAVLVLKNEKAGESPPISFPLSDDDINRIKAQAEHAPVGTKDSEEVVLKVRTT